MKSGIYKIRNSLNGKCYIGSACDIRRRWNEHRSMLTRGTHHARHLQAAWNLYGSAAFTFHVVEACEESALIEREQACIDAERPEYNVQPCARSSLGRALSEETKAKIAAKAVGRRWSAESKAKLSATLTGKKMPADYCARLLGNQRAKGYRHTDEWKAANSARNLGVKRPKDAEYRAKIAATLRGRKATPEARANQSAAQLGKKRGPYKKRRSTDEPNEGRSPP